MTDKLLYVDDDAPTRTIFQSLCDRLRQQGRTFLCDTLPDGEQGLEAVANRGPYAVIVSDLHMPRMDGIQFLRRVREISPKSVRIILTGYANLQAALDAVNEGSVFRFLTKPCGSESLDHALTAGFEQYRLLTAETELLEKTLAGSVKALTEVLSVVNPTAFGRAWRLQQFVRQLATELHLVPRWPLEMAALLSQVGCVSVPEFVLRKASVNADLSPEEARMLEGHPQVGHDLIAHIPRLDAVAEIIAYQEKGFDGSGRPREGAQGTAIPLGARLLKVALDFDHWEARAFSPAQCLEYLHQQRQRYDPAVLAALERILRNQPTCEVQEISLDDLRPGMHLAEDLLGVDNSVLVSKGQVMTPFLLLALRNNARSAAFQHPLRVRVRRVDAAGWSTMPEPVPGAPDPIVGYDRRGSKLVSQAIT